MFKSLYERLKNRFNRSPSVGRVETGYSAPVVDAAKIPEDFQPQPGRKFRTGLYLTPELREGSKHVEKTRRRSVHQTVYSSHACALWVQQAVRNKLEPTVIAQWLREHPSVSRSSGRSGSGL
jgi:hypothetical protein